MNHDTVAIQLERFSAARTEYLARRMGRAGLEFDTLGLSEAALNDIDPTDTEFLTRYIEQQCLYENKELEYTDELIDHLWRHFQPLNGYLFEDMNDQTYYLVHHLPSTSSARTSELQLGYQPQHGIFVPVKNYVTKVNRRKTSVRLPITPQDVEILDAGLVQITTILNDILRTEE